jgi:hypothetical protein
MCFLTRWFPAEYPEAVKKALLLAEEDLSVLLGQTYIDSINVNRDLGLVHSARAGAKRGQDLYLLRG